MDPTSNDLIHCQKSKKKARNIDCKVIQINNSLNRETANCLIYKTN